MPMLPKCRIPVTILTGFLGSRKTKLLTRLIHELRFSSTAVLIIEFGPVAIDDQFWSKVGPDSGGLDAVPLLHRSG